MIIEGVGEVFSKALVREAGSLKWRPSEDLFAELEDANQAFPGQQVLWPIVLEWGQAVYEGPLEEEKKP